MLHLKKVSSNLVLCIVFGLASVTIPPQIRQAQASCDPGFSDVVGTWQLYPPRSNQRGPVIRTPYLRDLSYVVVSFSCGDVIANGYDPGGGWKMGVCEQANNNLVAIFGTGNRLDFPDPSQEIDLCTQHSTEGVEDFNFNLRKLSLVKMLAEYKLEYLSTCQKLIDVSISSSQPELVDRF